MNYNDKKYIPLEDWKNFPVIISKNLDNDFISEIEWNDIKIKLGDIVIWNKNYEDGGTLFKIDAIKLSPSLRFWSDEKGGWFLPHNCDLIK